MYNLHKQGADTLMYSKNTILLVDDEEVVKQRLCDMKYWMRLMDRRRWNCLPKILTKWQ